MSNYKEKLEVKEETKIFTPLYPSRWTLFKARLFGVKKIGIDDNEFNITTTEVHLYKGTYYVTDVKVLEKAAKNEL